MVEGIADACAAARSVSCYRLIARLALFFLVAGCGSEPGFERYLREMPAAAELIGRWAPTEESLKALRAKGFKMTAHDQHELILRAGGMCTFRTHWQYSYVDAQDPEPASYFDTADCTWRRGVTGTRVGDTTFDAPALWLRVRAGARQADAYYFYVRRGDRLYLWQSVGEPDEGKYMDLIRVP